jgi:transcription initiation factor TFIIIB Brf1 subunit/transcription initiation factor TFIIB
MFVNKGDYENNQDRCVCENCGTVIKGEIIFKMKRFCCC